MLAAEDSTAVAQENHDRRLPLPKRAQADLAAIRIGQRDRRDLFAFRTHTESIISGSGIMLSGRGVAPGSPPMP